MVVERGRKKRGGYKEEMKGRHSEVPGSFVGAVDGLFIDLVCLCVCVCERVRGCWVGNLESLLLLFFKVMIIIIIK